MSIAYDSEGYAKTVVLSDCIMDRLDFDKQSQNEINDYVCMSIIPEWDDYTDLPSEIYVMIGNGFDLECGLPTSYRDFLQFVSAIEAWHNYPQKGFDEADIDLRIKDILQGKNPNYIIWEHVINNFWYKHFQEAQIKLGWVDFENELAKVIRIVESSMDLTRFHQATLDDYVAGMEISDLTRVLSNVLKTAGIKEEWSDSSGFKYIEYKMLYRELRDKLLKELEVFITGFETYLRDFVEPLDVEPTNSILLIMDQLMQSEEKYVISFNYTTIFERFLKNEGIEAEFCYVHGKIGDGKTRNRLVLGMDEYLNPEAVKNVIGFAPFRKYNQRIFKETDSNYMDWLDNIKEGQTLDRMLFIFGHSIGITDKDIIGPFVTANDMRTVLYYHNEDAFSNQVSNLTAIIGMDEMIKRTGGKRHTMEFRKQL